MSKNHFYREDWTGVSDFGKILLAKTNSIGLALMVDLGFVYTPTSESTDDFVKLNTIAKKMGSWPDNNCVKVVDNVVVVKLSEEIPDSSILYEPLEAD